VSVSLFDTVECMRKELEFLRKFCSIQRPEGLPLQVRVNVFVALRNHELVELLEERYKYGCDIELDLARLKCDTVEWKEKCILD